MNNHVHPAPAPATASFWLDELHRSLTLSERADLKVLDLFAGCGGLSLGFACAGFAVTGIEADHSCCETYKHNLHSTCLERFITEDSIAASTLTAGAVTKDTELPRTDILIGGPPCQPFSRFGNQKGEKDERNGFPAFIAAVHKLEPALWLFENVSDLATSMPDYFAEILSRLKALGYTLSVHSLSMADYGVPQRRNRMIVVGSFGSGFIFPSKHQRQISSREALGDLLTHTHPESAYLTASMQNYIASYEKKSGCTTPRDLRLDEPSRTLTCRNLAGRSADMLRIAEPDGRRRLLSIHEAARLQSFPDWYEFKGSSRQALHQIGNAVPPYFARQLADAVRGYAVTVC